MKSAVKTDVHNRTLGILKQSNGTPNAVFIDIGDRSFADIFFKKSAEILFISAGILSKGMHIKFFTIMLMNVSK